MSYRTIGSLAILNDIMMKKVKGRFDDLQKDKYIFNLPDISVIEKEKIISDVIISNPNISTFIESNDVIFVDFNNYIKNLKKLIESNLLRKQKLKLIWF